MKTVKVTKKNATRMINKLESQLREGLLPFTCSPFTYYGLSNEGIIGEYCRINIFSIDINPFITSAAINTVIKMFENSTIDKECMFYGIDSCKVPNTEREVPYINND